MDGLLEALDSWFAAPVPAVWLRVAEARGSTPRETGAAMLVTAGQTWGTVGGGALEERAILAARAMLARGVSGVAVDHLRVPLGPAIGQCCGGHVTLTLAPLTHALATAERERLAREAERQPVVMLYGAGHVGRALARALAPLPLRVRLLDGRADELARLGCPAVACVETPALPEAAEAAPPGAAHVVLTHSHALDARIVAVLLARDDCAYVGLIGSATKRATFEHALRAIGLAEDRIGRLVCPIGGDQLRDKRPEVIAALTAAEVATALLGSAEPTHALDRGSTPR